MFTAAELFCFGLLAVVIIGAALGLSSLSCSSRWANSGLKTSWGPAQGCLVHMPSGRWIPEERVRDIDLGSPAASAPWR